MGGGLGLWLKGGELRWKGGRQSAELTGLAGGRQQAVGWKSKGGRQIAEGARVESSLRHRRGSQEVKLGCCSTG